MIPFDTMALDLLRELGLKADICKTDDEARSRFIGDNPTSWPIVFFGSDTSGEKSFEEFFTDEEDKDEASFVNLGVVKNSKKRNLQEIDAIFNQLHELFESKEVTKARIVEILRVYLPNFEHIETGKGLDSKM